MRVKSSAISYAYLTIFLIAATVILLQVALTRVVSATASYHSAYVVLSIVMLGISASALAVYRDAQRCSSQQLLKYAIESLVWAGAATVLALFVYLLAYRNGFLGSISYGYAIFASVAFFPAFYFSGYCVAYLLSQFSTNIGRLYWFDLVGAAAGCLVVVWALNLLGALSVILLCAIALVVCPFILRLVGGDVGLSFKQSAIVLFVIGLSGYYILIPSAQLRTVPDQHSEDLLLKEQWNSLAKIAVYRESTKLNNAIAWFRKNNPSDSRSDDYLKRLWDSGWGLSNRYDGPVADRYFLDLDSGASTIIVGAGAARSEELEFLRWDVTAVGYSLIESRKNTQAFIIGGGGGRDILTAKVFGVSKINVVELNPGVVAAVEESFGSFSGFPYSQANVSLTYGEARSVLQRGNTSYDTIQMSMIDTFAATSSGAFVLAENNLYTREAFSLYLQKLKIDGVLSVSRWYTPEYPGELGKTLVLIREALSASGVDNPSSHVAVMYNKGYLQSGIATFLVKNQPFSVTEIEKLKRLCDQMGFSMLWPTSSIETSLLKEVLSGKVEVTGFEDYDFRAPTDNWPFFFNLKRPFYSWYHALIKGDSTIGSPATLTMLTILLLLLLASVRFVYRPLLAIARQAGMSKDLFVSTRYFASIGFGFMIIELGLLQRYIHFLGHPTYALTVVLFTILLSAGVGSLITERFDISHGSAVSKLPIYIAICGGLFSAFILPEIVELSFHFDLWIRILIAAACIAPFALAMGMIFPLGIRMLTHSGRDNLIPFMWGVNGIFSVFGSTIGMWIATGFGYTAVFIVGAISYVITLLSIRRSEIN